MNQPTSSIRPIVSLIDKHQQRLALSDEALSTALGYASTNVISMIKRGELIFPISKVIALAEALEIDPLDTFRAALGEMPELLAVIEHLYPLSGLSAAEHNLILHLRNLSGGSDYRPMVLDGRGVVALVTAT